MLRVLLLGIGTGMCLAACTPDSDPPAAANRGHVDTHLGGVATDSRSPDHMSSFNGGEPASPKL